ncbi:TetR/AcrR family transcriptional regulator [Archangium primigenium]|uniref:TetR/AcrR family transcriptional regulator n=1 Tax=[Archangium] primigenium TaxID=2792470 RepID=UPI00195DF16F|nr:TetR/AcrR family transcriptional regulator [Archangium primigenium]MBM7116114.1 TetR/AcrR family transcriptional regulator [Archangium primigenium]
MSPRLAVRVEQLREERRRDVLRAARKVFARRGFVAAKISDIASAAGISHGLVHHYFPTKEALFVAVIDDSIQGWEALIATAHARPQSAWERLVEVCAAMGEHSEAAGEHLLIIVHASMGEGAPAPVREALERLEQRVHAPLSELIEAAQRAGEATAGPPGELARAWMAVSQGLAISQALHPDRARPPLAMVLRLLKA